MGFEALVGRAAQAPWIGPLRWAWVTATPRRYCSSVKKRSASRFARWAPSYFQEIMATVVLVGLIYMICKMYIDDCSALSNNNIEFVTRIRSVFERFRKHNLYLKANKCFFGFKVFRKSSIWRRIENIPYKDPISTRFPSTHCWQTAEELFGNSELFTWLC